LASAGRRPSVLGPDRTPELEQVSFQFAVGSALLRDELPSSVGEKLEGYRVKDIMLRRVRVGVPVEEVVEGRVVSQKDVRDLNALAEAVAIDVARIPGRPAWQSQSALCLAMQISVVLGAAYLAWSDEP
jgi:hypothetical protein